MILGIGSSWSSVAGLSLDIVGFGLLAWDLLPDYRLNQLSRRFDRAMSALERLQAGHAQQPRPDTDDEAALEMWKLGNSIRRANLNLDRSEIGLLGMEAERLLGKSEHTEQLASRSNDLKKLNRSLEFLGGDLADAHVNSGHRPRPPIRLAIFCIFAGFALQVWGAIPVTSVANSSTTSISVPKTLSEDPLPMWQTVPPDLAPSI